MSKPTMTSANYEKLRKLVNMLSSEQEGEAMNALRAAGRILNGHGLTWSEILLPRKLLPVRIDAEEAVQADDGTDGGAFGPAPLGEATLPQMYRDLMNSPNVPVDIKRELRQHESAIKENRVRSAVRGEIQAMYSYAILHGRRL